MNMRLVGMGGVYGVRLVSASTTVHVFVYDGCVHASSHGEGEGIL